MPCCYKQPAQLGHPPTLHSVVWASTLHFPYAPSLHRPLEQVPCTPSTPLVPPPTGLLRHPTSPCLSTLQLHRWIHEYQLTPHSLYAAVSIGLECETILAVLNRLSKNVLPADIRRFVRACTQNYGKVGAWRTCQLCWLPMRVLGLCIRRLVWACVCRGTAGSDSTGQLRAGDPRQAACTHRSLHSCTLLPLANAGAAAVSRLFGGLPARPPHR